MTDKIVVLVTVPDQKTAETIANKLLKARLIACAQILPGLQSIYEWEGKVERSQEWLVILKSRSDAFETLSAKIQALHPYKVPQIVALPIERGHLPYLQWMDEVMGIPANRAE
ncbi:MAG: divalent-cation tolerance protein CutA [Candidatus Riflebacteria bacterium]|nr:divalent-cation tolerance protein CutA [Candidatus Riflebacteria bacterium]